SRTEQFWKYTAGEKHQHAQDQQTDRKQRSEHRAHGRDKEVFSQVLPCPVFLDRTRGIEMYLILHQHRAEDTGSKISVKQTVFTIRLKQRKKQSVHQLVPIRVKNDGRDG